MGKSKTVTYIIAVILVIAGLYWVYQMFVKAPTVTPVGGVTTTTVTGSGSSDKNKEVDPIVSALEDIDGLDLQNHLILSDKVFTSLQDFSRPIADRPVGRVNPFAPSSYNPTLPSSVNMINATTTGSTTNGQ